MCLSEFTYTELHTLPERDQVSFELSFRKQLDWIDFLDSPLYLLLRGLPTLHP